MAKSRRLKGRRLKGRRLLDFPQASPRTQYAQGLVKGLPYLEKRRERQIDQQRYEDERRRVREEMDYKYDRLDQQQQRAADKALAEILPKLSPDIQRRALDSLSPERRKRMGFGWYKPETLEEQAPTTPPVTIPAPPSVGAEPPTIGGAFAARQRLGTAGPAPQPTTGPTETQPAIPAPPTKPLTGFFARKGPSLDEKQRQALAKIINQNAPKLTPKARVAMLERFEQREPEAFKLTIYAKVPKEQWGTMFPEKPSTEDDELEDEFDRLAKIIGNPDNAMEYRELQFEKADKRIQPRLRPYLKAKKTTKGKKQTIGERQAEDKALADNALLHMEHLQGSDTFTVSTPLRQIQGNRDEALAGWPAYRDRWAQYGVSEKRAWRRFTSTYKGIVGLYYSKAPLPSKPPADPGEPMTPETAPSKKLNADMTDGDRVFEDRCRKVYDKLPSTERATVKALVKQLLDDEMPKQEILDLLE